MESGSTVSLNNGKITFLAPANIRVLSAEEARKMGGHPEHEWGARDEEHHMIFNVGWSKVPLFGGSRPLEKVVADTEKNLIRKRAPEYQRAGEIRRKISGLPAYGILYTYTVQNIHMEQAYVLVRQDKNYIAFLFGAREENFEAQYPVFEQMMDSAELR